MDRCDDCGLWFAELDNAVCIHCAEPWQEHPDSPAGLDLPDGPPGYVDLVKKLKLRPVRFEILLPFAHDQKNYYVESVVYEGKGRYWFIEGKNEPYNNMTDAVIDIAKMADANRSAMLNQAFEDMIQGLDLGSNDVSDAE